MPVDLVKMQPDKGWDYNSGKDLSGGVERVIASRKATANPVLLAALGTIMKDIPAVTLEEVYAKAQQAKPEFDEKIKSIASGVNGTALLSELKSLGRAEEKVRADLGGNASEIRDVLRASIIVENSTEVNEAYQQVVDNFSVVASRNGYGETINSSDGYFDAKLDIVISGIYAEIQIHTQSMANAKEQVHTLFEQRQNIKRSIQKGHRLSKDQMREIDSLNKQMREIFRKAANNE